MTLPFSFAPASFEELWCGATGVSTTSSDDEAHLTASDPALLMPLLAKR